MRRLILVVTIIAAVLGGRSVLAADIWGQTGFTYDWWDDDRDNSAYQLYIPLKIDSRFENFRASALTGFAYTEADPAGVESQSLSTILDTKLNFSYVIVGKFPVDLLAGIDFNIPTGKTNLRQEDLIVIMDPDLVTITEFGEGFNVNPTLIAVKGWEKWAAGLGVGYEWRGEYDFSENFPDYDPGDTINTTLQLRCAVSPEWQLRLFGNFTYYGEDEERGREFYQEGPMLLFGLRLHHVRESWDGALTLKGIFRDKSKIEDGSGGISTEPQNSHGTEWVADLASSHYISERTTLLFSLQGLFITENDYPTSDPRFIGERQKFTLGGGLRRFLSDRLDVEVRLKGFLMHDDASRFPVPIGERDTTGISITAHLSSKL